MGRYFFIKKFIFVLILIFSVSFLSFGCGEVDFQSHANIYISEYRKNLFANKTNSFLATFTSGERESDYDMTGVKTPLVDFGVLTVYFSIDIGNLSPTFELKINDEVFVGTLEKNPFDGSFVYDIERQVEDKDNIDLKLTDLEQNLKLVCLSSSWNTNWKDALEIFNQKFNKEVIAHTKNGKFFGEIYVKIVSKNRSLENVFWYVLCVCQDGEIYSCLIDPNSREILQ